MRLASYAAELARTVGAASVGGAREAYDVVVGPSVDHRDDVEQLVGHRGVAYVTKILDTNEAILAESGRKERERVFQTQRESDAATCGT